MATSNPSCAVALPRERNNATDAKSATHDATATEQNTRKPASIQELRAQLRAQLNRNQGKEESFTPQVKLRTSEASCAVALSTERNRATTSWGWKVTFPDRHPGNRIGGRCFESYIVPEQTLAEVQGIFPGAKIEAIAEVAE